MTEPLFQPLTLQLPNPDLSEVKNRFLAKLADTGVARTAADECDIPYATVCKWRSEDEIFRAAWAKAQEDCLEDRAMQRALAGDTPLLMFLLKSSNRARYDDAVARNTAGMGDIQITLVDATAPKPDPEPSE